MKMDECSRIPAAYTYVGMGFRNPDDNGMFRFFYGKTDARQNRPGAIVPSGKFADE